MTTIAMAAGMFPSALGLGDGGGFRSPMAIAVIGGLIVSTLLSLVFVPAVFTLIDDRRPPDLARSSAASSARRTRPIYPRPAADPPEEEIDPSALPSPAE